MDLPSKIPRTIAVALLGFAVAFAALGAWGTICVAWNAEAWSSFVALAPFKWVYQILVYINAAAAIAGAVVVYAVLRGERWSFTGSIGILLIYLTTAAAQMSLTSTLKHISFYSTPPTNIRFYTTVTVLVFFLSLKLTSRKSEVFSRAGSSSMRMSAGLCMIVAGFTPLTVFFWIGSSHIVDGHNLVSVFEVPLILGGGALSLIGMSLLAFSRFETRLLSRGSQDTPFLSWFKRRRT
jgi:hypothetical protein